MKIDSEFECPWCSDALASTDGPSGWAGDAFACATCSIVVELAPDPVAVPVARAA